MSGFSSPNIRSIPLDPSAISADFTSLTRSQRKNLDDKDLEDIMKHSIEQPFDYQYEKISHNHKSNDDRAKESFKTTALMRRLNQSLLKRLKKYDLNSWFESMPMVNPDLGWRSDQDQLDLFANLDALVELENQEKIFDSVAWINCNIEEKEWTRELDWSKEIILTACSTTMKEYLLKEEEAVMKNHQGAYGGPVIFVLLISHLLKNSREALNDLWEFMKNLKVTDYENEDVHTMVYELRVNFERIYRVVDAGNFRMPTDFILNLIQIFQTSSCKKFNDTFAKLEIDKSVNRILKSNANRFSTFAHRTGSSLTWMEILNVATDTYKLHEKDWIAAVEEQGPGNHGFLGKESGGKKKGPCHGCGGDHWLRECPHKQRNQNQNNHNQDNNRKDPDIVPPSVDTCTKVQSNPNRWTKKVGNETVHWCGKCVKRNLSDGSRNTIKGRWTNGGSKHFTDEHRGSQPRQGPRGGGGRGAGGRGGNHDRANLANTTPTPSAAGTVASDTDDVVTNLTAALADSDVNGRQPDRNQDNNRKDPDIVPPSVDTCTKVQSNPNRWTKKVGNETVHWCGKCVKRNLSDGSRNTIKGRWTNGGSKHFTDEHRGSQPRQGPRGGGGRGAGGRGGNHDRANLANTTPTPSAAGTVASDTDDVVTNLTAALADSDVNGRQPAVEKGLQTSFYIALWTVTDPIMMVTSPGIVFGVVLGDLDIDHWLFRLRCLRCSWLACASDVLVQQFLKVAKIYSTLFVARMLFELPSLVDGWFPSTRILSPLLGDQIFLNLREAQEHAAAVVATADVIAAECNKVDSFYEPLFEAELERLSSLYEASMLAASDEPTHRIQSLLDNIDVLEMHGMLSLFERPQTVRSTNMDEVYRLRALVNDDELFTHLEEDTIEPPLSCKDRMLYESIVPLAVVDLKACNAVSIDAKEMPIFIDTGASRSLSPHRSDFTSYRPIKDMAIGGITANSRIAGVGKVRWEVTDQNGLESVIITEAYHVVDATIRLYSPQFHFREHNAGRLEMDALGISLTLPTPTTPVLSFPFNSFNNLPLMLPSSHPHLQSTLFQSEGHFNLSNLSLFLREVPVVERFNLVKADMEVLDAKERAYVNEKKIDSQLKSNDPKKEMALQRNHLNPGECVSLDQYVVPHRGQLYKTAGKEREALRYGGGSLAVDHASKRVFITHQVSLKAEETLVFKRNLERDAADCGFEIQRYHADNGVFAAKAFMEDCINKDQKLQYSASNTHHQNGVVERYIGTITRMARAMLIHVALLWPKQNKLEHWPMAMDHAVWVWNNLPMDDGLSPEEKWTGSKVPSYNHLRRAHVWCCPAYVLDPKLADGKKIPKWSPRSRQGKFMGYSKDHSNSAGLILNPKSGYLSTQFHVLYDDKFETVEGCTRDQQRQVAQDVDWQRIIDREGAHEINYEVQDEDLVPDFLDDEWLNEEEIRYKREARNERMHRHARNVVPNPNARQPALRDPGIIVVGGNRRQVQVENQAPAGASNAAGTPAPNGNPAPQLPPLAPAEIDQARDQAEGMRRTRRNRNAPERLEYDRPGGPNQRNRRDIAGLYSCGAACTSKAFVSHSEAEGYQNTTLKRIDLDNHFVQGLSWEESVSALSAKDKFANDDARRFFARMEVLQDPETLDMSDFPTLAFAARASADDNPRFDEAMRGPNAEGFWQASAKEITTLQKINTWTQVPREAGMNVIKSTWAFKIKRFPDGLFRKLKARFCVRGDQQIEGVDFFDTFVPVVQWSTIRMMFILSLQLGLASVQVDYVSAFCQAPIDEVVHVDLPRGWQTLNEYGLHEKFKPNHVLRLNRSCYGLRQSPKNFFNHLKKNLERSGLKQSVFDPCLFISDEVICVCYVDDCLFWAKDRAMIDAVIDKIKEKMTLEVEDSVDGFLGIKVERKPNEDGVEEIHLTQAGLINRVIVALGLDSESSHGTKIPAEANKPLPKDSEGDPYYQGFNYPSVVGMMMYLCNNSRPDIAFAVHQCARHSFRPTRLHAQYLIKIGRYLIRTRDKGLIIKPDPDVGIFDIDCYVDADFAGLFSVEDNQDPHCVKSRTGYVIMVGGSPVVWSSKLQPVIASSTMESEYIALSTACKELIPIRNIASEIAEACGVASKDVSSMHTTIWEDNVGCLTLANLELPLLTPRSKAIAVRYHWFRQFGSKDQGRDGGIVIKKVDTKNQIADIFTKGLPFLQFSTLRKMLMGW
ncbi:hypothetical protein CTEN210_07229 [Chaetoceros tenuissimus]|uniref:Reverse transcriptase Ty1/copia-type domain-containing protein n=1 Tax=Chaetoceros tenuissimus TaxID=426638 RepID=A0AAD3CRC4_9STRA|nr:hypothetical protein CTEN210_07229 [Chaetoceros tenuissimus]